MALLVTFAAEAPSRDKSFILLAAIAIVVDVDRGVSVPLTWLLISDERKQMNYYSIKIVVSPHFNNWTSPNRDLSSR